MRKHHGSGPGNLNTEGSIYVISVEKPLMTKIGFTTNLSKRREQYLSHFPLSPDFSHTERGTVAIEKRAQRLCKRILRLKGDLRVGEWFDGLTIEVAKAAISEARRQLEEESALEQRNDSWAPPKSTE